MASIHVHQDARATGAETVGEEQSSPTCSGRRLSPERLASGEQASRIVGVAATSTCSMSAVARSLGVSADVVAHWADPEHAAAITLRDLLAGRRDFARAVLGAALATLDERSIRPAAPPERQVVRISAAVGTLAGDLDDALADGVVTDEERARLLRDIDAANDGLARLRRSLGGA